VADLHRLANPALLGQDVREERFIEHTLQIALQSALDVASHLVVRSGHPLPDLMDLFMRART
jgi:uncharacterized protein YutE (UPF0331/DUF86 family)